MDILVIVNEGPRVINGPGDTSLAMTALRFVLAAQQAGHQVPVVFFQGDGIENALEESLSEVGSQSAAARWAAVGEHQHTQLLLCSAALARRTEIGLSAGELPDRLPPGFSQAGLPFMWDIAGQCDRVVTF